MEIILEKGKIYRKFWNSKKREWLRKLVNPKKEQNPLHFLQYAVTLSEGFTLRDLFKTVENYPLLQFIDNFFFDFVKEYKSCPSKNCKCGDINAILLSKYIEIEEDGELSDHISVDGRGENETYAIDFSPLSELLDLPIILSTAEIIVYKKPYKKQKRIQHETYYNLWDVLHNVIYELSFHGSPKSRNKAGKHLLDVVKDCTSGKGKLIPFEDVITPGG